MIFPILPDGWGLLKAYQEKQNGWIYHPDLRGNDTQKAGHMFVWYFRRYSLIILHFGANMCTEERESPSRFPKSQGRKEMQMKTEELDIIRDAVHNALEAEASGES